MLAALLLNPEHVQQFFAGHTVQAPGLTELEQIILDDDEVILKVIAKFVERQA